MGGSSCYIGILTKKLFSDGKFWDFTSDLAKSDTAYTTLALSAHTDNTYFVSPSPTMVLEYLMSRSL